MFPTTPFQTESEVFTPNDQSITNTAPAIIKDDTNTRTDDSWSSFQEGQVTFVISSV